MKATTCVRVVLPTDELVRVECAATMSVADLMSSLKKHCNFQTSNGIERNGGSGTNPFDDNNGDADPANEASLVWRSKVSLSKLGQGKLKLVRQESELKSGSLVVDEVEELDILEFQLVDSNASGRMPETMCQISRNETARILRPAPQKSRATRKYGWRN
ncbi:hypothetical protein PRIC1_013535 [Phytophthora ramorum]